jgi:hypothetical protein
MKKECSKKEKIDNRKMFDSSETNVHVRQTLLLSHAIIDQQFKLDDELIQ